MPASLDHPQYRAMAEGRCGQRCPRSQKRPYGRGPAVGANRYGLGRLEMPVGAGTGEASEDGAPPKGPAAPRRRSTLQPDGIAGRPEWNARGPRWSAALPAPFGATRAVHLPPTQRQYSLTVRSTARSVGPSMAGRRRGGDGHCATLVHHITP